MISSAKGDADRHCLAARFVDGPHLSVPDKAEQHLADWLADLEPVQSGCDRRSRDAVSARQNHSFGHRRSLALSVRSGSRRWRARAPAARMRAGGASGATDRNRLPRGGCGIQRSRSDAAAAPDEIGSSLADCAVRHRRRLAGDAGHRGPDRSCGRLGAIGAAVSAAAGSRAGPAVAARSRFARGRQRSGRAGDGQDGRRRVELFQRHRPDRVLRFGSTYAGTGYRAAAVLRAGHAGAVAAAAAAQRRWLCVPRRPAAAARSGLDAGGDLDHLGAALLRAGRPDLGARGHDQGAALRRRRARPARRWSPRSRRSSGASIWISQRLPTCTT